jgi:hypothetical protein
MTSNLSGGLGNLMFQIATSYSLSLDNNDTTIYDDDSHSGIRHVHIDTYKNNILRKLHYGKPTIENYYNEPYFHYTPIPYSNNLKILGYFQSEEYFKHNREKILEYFDIDDVSYEYIKNKYSKILENNTCSIHVRRGNYVGLSNIHPPCGLSYYNEAIKELSSDTVFLVFSDDINWCRENFTFSNLTHYIEDNPNYIDLWLMSLCNNNIIANSSFSWWGAWLNRNVNKKVIAPKKWFGHGVNHNTQDLIPIEWIKI